VVSGNGWRDCMRVDRCRLHVIARHLPIDTIGDVAGDSNNIARRHGVNPSAHGRHHRR